MHELKSTRKPAAQKFFRFLSWEGKKAHHTLVGPITEKNFRYP